MAEGGVMESTLIGNDGNCFLLDVGWKLFGEAMSIHEAVASPSQCHDGLGGIALAFFHFP